MDDLGFMIWYLPEIRKYCSPDGLAELCNDMGVRWISIKVANGELPYNLIDKSDAILVDYITTLQAADVEVGGWVYNYPFPPSRPGVEAELYERLIYDYGLDHLFYDVECEWKKPKLEKQIIETTDIYANIPVGLCSYRFPNLHPGIDWKTWVNRPAINCMAPQVYWELAHNPGSQLRKSYVMYRNLTKKPFIPIGSSYGRGKWEPTCKDFVEFIDTAKALGCPGYGFYSLDWCLKHNKMDWLSTIAGHQISLPE